jgi:hypothetical protein
MDNNGRNEDGGGGFFRGLSNIYINREGREGREGLKNQVALYYSIYYKINNGLSSCFSSHRSCY